VACPGPPDQGQFLYSVQRGLSSVSSRNPLRLINSWIGGDHGTANSGMAGDEPSVELQAKHQHGELGLAIRAHWRVRVPELEVVKIEMSPSVSKAGDLHYAAGRIPPDAREQQPCEGELTQIVVASWRSKLSSVCCRCGRAAIPAFRRRTSMGCPVPRNSSLNSRTEARLAVSSGRNSSWAPACSCRIEAIACCAFASSRVANV
jgi:hypothetical protein